MDRALGLLLLTLYIVGIVGLAAAMTFVVIKLFPTKRTPKDGKPPEDGKSRKQDEQKSPVDGEASGRLYRRAKRGAT